MNERKKEKLHKIQTKFGVIQTGHAVENDFGRVTSRSKFV